MRAQKFCFAHGVFVRAAHGLFKPRHVAHQQDLNQRPADLRREGFDKKALFCEHVQPVDQARAKVSMMCQMKRTVFLLQFVVEKEKSTPLKRIEHHGKQAVNLRQRRCGHICRRGHLRKNVVHQRGDDILLFGEMIGEVAHADGKRVGNRAHGDVAVALFVEKPQGDGQNFFTGG